MNEIEYMKSNVEAYSSGIILLNFFLLVYSALALINILFQDFSRDIYIILATLSLFFNLMSILFLRQLIKIIG